MTVMFISGNIPLLRLFSRILNLVWFSIMQVRRPTPSDAMDFFLKVGDAEVLQRVYFLSFYSTLYQIPTDTYTFLSYLSSYSMSSTALLHPSPPACLLIHLTKQPLSLARLRSFIKYGLITAKPCYASLGLLALISSCFNQRKRRFQCAACFTPPTL